MAKTLKISEKFDISLNREIRIITKVVNGVGEMAYFTQESLKCLCSGYLLPFCVEIDLFKCVNSQFNKLYLSQGNLETSQKVS